MEVIFVEEVINLIPKTSMDKEKHQTSRQKDKPSISSRNKEVTILSNKRKPSGQKENNSEMLNIRQMVDDLDDEIFLSRDLEREIPDETS